MIEHDEKCPQIVDKIKSSQMMDITIVQTSEPKLLANMDFGERLSLYTEIEAKAFYMRGKILQTIQEDKCYKKAGYKTFELAVKSTLGISKSFAYAIIDATIAFDNLSSNCGQIPLPTAESQLRPISKLLPEQQIEVWQEVAKDKVPTAKEVQEAVNKRKNKVAKTTKSITTKVDNSLLQENERLKLKVKELEQIISNLDQSNINLTTILLSYNTPPEIIQEAIVVQKEILLTRTEMSETITTYGTGFQPMVLARDIVSNAELFRTVVAIRNRFEENKSTIPNPLSKRVMLATGPEPEEDIGTLKSLPRSDIKI